MTENTGIMPIPVQLHMGLGDFYGVTESAFQWSIADAFDIEEGRFEPVDGGDGVVSLEWTHAYYVADRADLVLAKSYLTAIGERFDVLFDLTSRLDPDVAEPGENWAQFVLLTNFGLPWPTDADCPSCGLPSGSHWENCDRYAQDKAKYPAMVEALPIEWKGRTTATIPTDDDEDD